jgi:hypothetical protein
MTNTKTTDAKTNATHTPPTLIAWHVAEWGEQKFWTRIGAAWQHKDGEGMGLQLDLLPVAGGRIVLRAPKHEEEGAATPAP